MFQNEITITYQINKKVNEDNESEGEEEEKEEEIEEGKIRIF